MLGIDDFTKWSEFGKEEKAEIKEQMPKDCLHWFWSIVDFTMLILKIPLQLYFVTYQVNKVWTNEEEGGAYNIPTKIVYYFEFVAIILFCLSILGRTVDWTCGKRDNPAHSLENLYTNLFKTARFSLMIIIPYVALRQISTSLLSILRKIYNSGLKIQNNFGMRNFPWLLYNAINMLFLIILFLSWWFLVPCAIIIKLRQMEFILDDRWFIEWHYDEIIVFFGFLNQLSSMCETVELPQVFLGQFLYSKDIELIEEERCTSCNSTYCKALGKLLEDKRIIGSILEYGPGVHYIRTKVVEYLYKECDKNTIKALAVLHSFKYHAYCRIFRHRISQGIHPKSVNEYIRNQAIQGPIVKNADTEIATSRI